MRFNNIKYIGLFTVLMVCAISCKKEEVACNDVPVESGWLVLNEGLFQQNNSTLSYYNTSNQSVTQQTFFNVNNRGLGDTGNDMVRYGSKIYIAVNVSGTIEVIDANNFQFTLISMEQTN